jgi:signal transduction histidine kinase/ligand-binding sensor domain-containing protein
MAEDDEGALLVYTLGGIFRVVDGRSSLKVSLPRSIPSGPGQMLRDRDGGLWIGTQGSGLVHVHDGLMDVYTQADGLSGDSIRNLFEDREGTIWVATNAGLDRFRDAAGTALTARQGLSNPRVQALAAAADGSVWANAVDALYKLGNHDITIYRERTNSSVPHQVSVGFRRVREISADWANRLTAVFEDRRGRMWVAAARGVGYLDRDRLVPVDGLRGGSTRAIVEDSEKLWVIDDERGVFQVRSNGRAVAHVSPAVFNHEDAITAAEANVNGKGVWLGFMKGGVVFFADGRVQASYDAAHGLGAGTIRQLLFDRDASVWAATEAGLSRLKDGRVATLTHRSGLPCDAIVSIVQDETRALWLTTRCGVVRISREEITQWISNGGTVRTTKFDDTEGLRTYVDMFPYSAPTVRSVDGRLWFVSPDGLSVIDPRRLAINTRPPPVHVEGVTADRKGYDAAMAATGQAIRLPPLVRDLQIDYTALSLVAPEKNQFRYKLEGYDRDWQDAGTRRQAFYTNLRPRSYRFRVVASNNSGVWNDTGAAIDIMIPPAFYQTNWFTSLVVGMTAALLWAAHRVRLRVVEKHEREISALNERMMKAQEQERIRIAGELHDGVMQQMLAVTMMLGSAKRKIASNPVDAEASIERIQQKVIQTGTDIRQLSHGLHPPLLQDEGLPGALRSYCDQFGGASGMAVSCDAEESTRELSRGAALALFRITQEALGNAAKYAAAKHVRVRLERSNGTVTLTVSDDGVGFDRNQLGTSGGLGLVMMRERAGQLNGTSEFESAPGRGTTIRVVIPFR